MAILVLEQSFDQPITPEEMNEAARGIDRCLQQHGARWMRSYVSKDRRRIICEFEAADAEQIRQSYRSAGVEFDNCWSADLYTAEKPTESY
jgi:hypothetical protein